MPTVNDSRFANQQSSGGHRAAQVWVFHRDRGDGVSACGTAVRSKWSITDPTGTQGESRDCTRCFPPHPKKGFSKSRFAARLRSIRKARGMTQGDVAEAAGVSISIICNYEKGRKVPTIKVAFRLASALRVSLGELLDEDRPPVTVCPRCHGSGLVPVEES